MGRLNVPHRLTILAGGIAALMVLFPPWQDATGRPLDYGPLFAPPQYTTMSGQFRSGTEPTYDSFSFERDPTTGRMGYRRGEMIDPGRPAELPTFETHTATIAWGRLVTQLAALGVMTAVVPGVTRRRQDAAAPVEGKL